MVFSGSIPWEPIGTQDPKGSIPWDPIGTQDPQGSIPWDPIGTQVEEEEEIAKREKQLEFQPTFEKVSLEPYKKIGNW